MKGQVFLLIAAVIIGVLVTLRGFATVSQTTTEREILDVTLEDLAFKNVENEIKQVMTISASTPRNISGYSIDFLNFTRQGANRISLDFTALFVGALANATNQTMNITVFNFLKEDNLNVTIRLNTSTSQGNSTFLNDGDVWVNNFTFTRGEVYNLTISLPTINYEENITVRTRGRDTYTAFHDIKLTSSRAAYAAKLEQNTKIQ